jgi:hypothetical protein
MSDALARPSPRRSQGGSSGPELHRAAARAQRFGPQTYCHGARLVRCRPTQFLLGDCAVIEQAARRALSPEALADMADRRAGCEETSEQSKIMATKARGIGKSRHHAVGRCLLLMHRGREPRVPPSRSLCPETVFARMRIQWPLWPGAHGSNPRASIRRSSAVSVISSQTPRTITLHLTRPAGSMPSISNAAHAEHRRACRRPCRRTPPVDAGIAGAEA